MSAYERFRSGCNQIDVEEREIAKIEALERIARTLEAILKVLTTTKETEK